MLRKKLPIVVAALAAIPVSTLPAASHSAAKCKFEFFDSCLEAGWSHAFCVNVAELQCAGHSHGGSGAGSQAAGSGYQSRQPGTRAKIFKRPVRRAYPQLQLVPPW